MAKMKQQVTVRSSGEFLGVAAVLGVILAFLLVCGLVVAVVAMFTLALVVVGVSAVVGLTVLGIARMRRHQARAEAALYLWRRTVQEQAQQAPSEALRHAALVQLADPPAPRVALAMLEAERRPIVTPAWQSTHPLDSLWRRLRG